MRLDQILTDVDVIETRGDLAIEVTNVAGDSRRCVPGSLFVAIPGLERDGATFIGHAIERGSVAVITESALEEREGVTSVRTSDAREALAVAAANAFGRPAERLLLIGVTGTSGKTTTTKMIESILDASGSPVGLVGTIEYRAGEIREIADRTTPDAVMLQEWFARMIEQGVETAVMEVSSHALALKRTHGVPFRIAVFTNLSRDHFDFHVDYDDYFGAKRMLFSQIDTTRKSAVINIDDSWGRRLAEELGDAVMSFGIGQDADIHPASGFDVSIDGLRGELSTPYGPVRISSPLVGMPNLQNWMAAVGSALLAGVGIEAIEKGVQDLASVRGRFERVHASGSFEVFVDYAHKPDALEKLLKAVRDVVGERHIVLVFGCGGDRDRGKRPVMGEIAGRLADFTIITSDNPRGEDPLEIVSQIEKGIVGVEGADFTTVIDRREAIRAAIRGARDKDVIVVAGKGHEDYQVVGDRIIPFDDREEIGLALEGISQKV